MNKSGTLSLKFTLTTQYRSMSSSKTKESRVMKVWVYLLGHTRVQVKEVRVINNSQRFQYLTLQVTSIQLIESPTNRSSRISLTREVTIVQLLRRSSAISAALSEIAAVDSGLIILKTQLMRATKYLPKKKQCSKTHT